MVSYNPQLVTLGLQEKWKDMFQFDLTTNIFEISTKKEESEFHLYEYPNDLV